MPGIPGLQGRFAQQQKQLAVEVCTLEGRCLFAPRDQWKDLWPDCIQEEAPHCLVQPDGWWAALDCRVGPGEPIFGREGKLAAHLSSLSR